MRSELDVQSSDLVIQLCSSTGILCYSLNLHSIELCIHELQVICTCRLEIIKFGWYIKQEIQYPVRNHNKRNEVQFLATSFCVVGTATLGEVLMGIIIFRCHMHFTIDGRKLNK